MQRWTIDLTLVIVGAGSGAGAGLLIGGLGSRMAMRLVAYALDIPVSFSPGGTFFIFLMGLILGTALGGLYGLVQWLIPLSTLVKGLLFGALLCAILVVLPFLSVTDGELALVSPFVGIVLFGWIPLLYSLAVAVVVDRYTHTYQGTFQRRVSAPWLVGYGCALIFAFASMSSLINDTARTPGLVRRLLENAGVTFHQVGDVAGFVGAGIVLTWLILATLIFWLGNNSRAAKTSAILLLLFAGAFFHREKSLDGWFAGLAAGQWSVALVRTLGLGALLYLFVLAPYGMPERSWPRPVLLLWALGLLYWFLGPARILSSELPVQAETGLLVALALMLGSGLAVQFYRCLEAQPGDERRRRWCVAGGFTLSAAAFLLVWGLTLIVPGMRLRQASGFATAFAVAPYLLPWLTLPVALVFAMWRYRLWQPQAIRPVEP